MRARLANALRRVPRAVVIAGLVLLAVDLLLITVDVVSRLATVDGESDQGWWRLNEDRGAAELWLDLKLVATALVLWRFSNRQPIHRATSIVLLLVVAEDLLRVHENVGSTLGEHFDFATFASLEPSDVGQLVVFGCYGLGALVLLSLAWRRSDSRGQTQGAIMAIPIVLLGVFGAVVDVVHAGARGNRWVSNMFVVIEDGGEVVVGSLAVAVAAWLMTTVRNSHSHPGTGQ